MAFAAARDKVVGVSTIGDLAMRLLVLSSIFAASVIFGGAAQAVPSGGLPDQVCSGPAGASNPHCQGNGAGQPGAPVPEPGAAGVFAIGVALIARSQRRTR